MYVVTVVFRIHPDKVDSFLPAMQRNARLSLENEAGCRRFDVAVGDSGVDTVFLYELYTDEAAFKAHVASAHFQEFDAEVADWVADKQVATYKLLM